MMKGVAIPYVIALILGVVVIGILGYWFVSYGGSAIGTGTQAECDASDFNYCKGFVKTWDTKCGEPNCGEISPAKCGNTIKEEEEQCDPPGSTEIKDIKGVGKCTYNCGDNCKVVSISCKPP
ncbi:MAG: hypothetical protein HYS80_01015 [Candidatus Aenigmarchaeota archaeon]|nr:hypothetical protein [Candidatus Aenigmarchaeota archaeon]